jgi:hypothetical protein
MSASKSNIYADNALVDNVTEFIKTYLTERLICQDPEGNTADMSVEHQPDLYQAFYEVSVDMFEAGAAWSDMSAGRKEKSILTAI